LKKLILFDIDATLVLTGRAGVRAMNRAFAHLLGTRDALDGVEFAGRTDRAIVRDALARVQPGEVLSDEWIGEFRRVYCGLLEDEVANGTPEGRKQVLPGVREVLDGLSARPDVHLALLTGNFEQGARIKLAHFGLWDYFAGGAFGDAHVDRNLLLPTAWEDARSRGVDPAPARTFVIGDTPYDVACARSGGAVAIAVATGWHTAEQLLDAGANVVFDDMSDTAAVLSALRS
jgi:phosphoglycolate phosphatase-like HAD superfamily hydrolase